jgi:regulatory protein
MPSQDFKKAYQLLSARCSKKETTVNEALKYATKFKLKLVEKHQLINQLKKEKFIDHQRFAKSFVHDRVKFYKWGKLKIKYHLIQKGIEVIFIDDALDTIDKDEYYSLIYEEAKKKHESSGAINDFVSRQKLCKYLNQKGFEGEIVFEIVESLES